jgi:hypothetical protein
MRMELTSRIKARAFLTSGAARDFVDALVGIASSAIS